MNRLSVESSYPILASSPTFTSVRIYGRRPTDNDTWCASADLGMRDPAATILQHARHPCQPSGHEGKKSQVRALPSSVLAARRARNRHWRKAFRPQNADGAPAISAGAPSGHCVR